MDEVKAKELCDKAYAAADQAKKTLAEAKIYHKDATRLRQVAAEAYHEVTLDLAIAREAVVATNATYDKATEFYQLAGDADTQARKAYNAAWARQRAKIKEGA